MVIGIVCAFVDAIREWKIEKIYHKNNSFATISTHAIRYVASSNGSYSSENEPEVSRSRCVVCRVSGAESDKLTKDQSA